MVVVPTITLAASVAISWVVLRSRIRARGLFDFIAFLPLAIPAIVFSVAALLLALFVMRHFAADLRHDLDPDHRLRRRAALLRHAHDQFGADPDPQGVGGNPRRSAARRPAACCAACWCRCSRPALAYAWIWIALLTYRELTLPVVISTSNNLPFSYLVWGFVQASAYGSASAAALLMLCLMLPVLLLYWLVARRAGMIAPR